MDSPALEDELGSPPNIELIDFDDLFDIKLTEEEIAELIQDVKDPDPITDPMEGALVPRVGAPTEDWTSFTTTQVTTEVFLVCVETKTVVTTTFGPRQ